MKQTALEALARINAAIADAETGGRYDDRKDDGAFCEVLTDDLRAIRAELTSQHNVTELVEALEAALAWIDAVPDETQLPAMPGFGRDEVDELISRAKGG